MYTMNNVTVIEVNYRRILFSRTSKGNKNWFEKSGGSKNRGKKYRGISEGNENWLEKSGGSKNCGEN